MNKSITKIADLLDMATITFNILRKNEAVRQQLEACGLTPALQQTGQQRLTAFRQLHTESLHWRDEQWQMSQQIEEGFRAVCDQLKVHVRIAQVAFREDTMLLHSLKVHRIETRRWECVRQAEYFYAQLRSRKLSLRAYGITDKELQQSAAAVSQLMQRREDRMEKKGLVEQQSQDKHRAQKALRAWMTDFRMIARVAFRTQPQLLEMFGMPVASMA